MIVFQLCKLGLKTRRVPTFLATSGYYSEKNSEKKETARSLVLAQNVFL